MAQLAGADQVPYCGISILWLSVALCVPFRATVGVSPGKPFGLWMDLTWEKLYGVETRLTCLGRGGHLRAVWLVCKTRPLRERSLSLLDWKTSWNNASFTKQYIKAGNNDILAVTGSDTEGIWEGSSNLHLIEIPQILEGSALAKENGLQINQNLLYSKIHVTDKWELRSNCPTNMFQNKQKKPPKTSSATASVSKHVAACSSRCQIL